MTQLVRPVQVPSQSAGDSESCCSAASAPIISGSVPGWTIASAALCPVLLVGGWLAADELQQGPYDPVQQTMSVLAGQPGTDPWIMTGALFLVGGSQLVTAAGLCQVGTPERVLLAVAGICTFGVATSPEPVAGPSPIHLAFASSCVFTTAIWPIFVARRPLFVARRPATAAWIVSSYGCAAVTAVFAVLSAWVVYAAFGGGDLGLAERVTSAALGLFPLIVAVSLRRAGSLRT